MKSKICPYRKYCQNECLDCDFSITFEKQNKKIKNSKKKLATSDLINRQKEEIERLEKGFPMSASFLFEKAKLDELLIRTGEAESKFKDKIKAEAYKECIEKVEERIAVHLLRDKSNEYAEGFADALDGVNGELDNLLKEMVGDKQ